MIIENESTDVAQEAQTLPPLNQETVQYIKQLQ